MRDKEESWVTLESLACQSVLRQKEGQKKLMGPAELVVHKGLDPEG